MEEKETALFGPAGNSEDFYARGFKSTLQAPQYLAQMGLTAYEYSCGRGVMLKEETARKIGDAAAQQGIRVSIHAPYFTNLCNPDPEKQAATLNYLLQAAQAVTWMGGRRVIFHPGALMKSTRQAARERAEDCMRRAVEEVLGAFPHVVLCPETLGKRNQYGTLEEVLALCAPYGEHVVPCIDFAHLHAAGTGCIQGEADFDALLAQAEEALGSERMRFFHMHFSHIEYTAAGEKRHRTFAEPGFGPDFAALAPCLVRRGMRPTVICESAGTQAADAATMQKIYVECAEKAQIKPGAV